MREGESRREERERERERERVSECSGSKCRHVCGLIPLPWHCTSMLNSKKLVFPDCDHYSSPEKPEHHWSTCCIEAEQWWDLALALVT